MMDRNEIIRRLEKIAGHAVHTVMEPPLVLSLDDGTALYDAAALLKEQKPKQVEAEVINEIDRLYRCPSCHISMILRKQPYCHYCGQELRWE